MFTIKEIKKALKTKGYTDYEINHTINLIKEMKTLSKAYRPLLLFPMKTNTDVVFTLFKCASKKINW
jgi:hypothetical protein